ncbi:MAG: hypothetical protein VX709_14620 [Pseudomonadota bacterium]|nr:hypothetical protein [Pseudomonadota bacterium]
MRKQLLLSFLNLLISCVVLSAMAEATLPAAKQQDSTHQYLQDRQQWQEQISLLEQEAGPFSLQMIEPLKNYALLLAKNNDREMAVEALRRAQHILHRQQGVHTPEQLNLMHQLVSISLQGHDYLNADGLQAFIFYLSNRDDNLDSKITAQRALANWYLNSGQFKLAITTVTKTIDLVESRENDQSLRLIELLLDKTLYRQMAGLCCNRKYLEEALQIAESAQAAVDIKDDIQFRLADVSLLESQHARAISHWQRLSTSITSGPRLITGSRKFNDREEIIKRYYRVTDDPLRRQFLQEMSREQKRIDLYLPPQFFTVNNNLERLPIVIRKAGEITRNKEKLSQTVGYPFAFLREQLEQILPLRLQKTDGMNTLSLKLNFTVTDKGRVKEIRIEGEAPRSLKKLLRDTLITSRYRPALESGQPITTHDVSIIQTFTTYDINPT